MNVIITKSSYYSMHNNNDDADEYLHAPPSGEETLTVRHAIVWDIDPLYYKNHCQQLFPGIAHIWL